jgi:16S rRNA (cytidine1402-2'-O)-methyltransferase
VGGRLVVCPTPIGNLEDVTLRVLRVLGEADAIACEDTRHTRRLLGRHGISGPRLVSYHEHNERRRAGELAGRIESGEVVALVSVPRRAGELRAALAAGQETLVAFESPGRLPKTLALLAEVDPERPVAVCRELTKLHEEVVRGSARELAERFAGGTRGEIVLVIGAGDAGGAGADASGAREAVEALVEAGARRRAAARVVSQLTGLPANRLYRD